MQNTEFVGFDSQICDTLYAFFSTGLSSPIMWLCHQHDFELDMSDHLAPFFPAHFAIPQLFIGFCVTAIFILQFGYSLLVQWWDRTKKAWVPNSAKYRPFILYTLQKIKHNFDLHMFILFISTLVTKNHALGTHLRWNVLGDFSDISQKM